MATQYTKKNIFVFRESTDICNVISSLKWKIKIFEAHIFTGMGLATSAIDSAVDSFVNIDTYKYQCIIHIYIYYTLYLRPIYVMRTRV